MLSRKTSLLMGFLAVFVTVIGGVVQAQTTTVTSTVTSTATTIITSTRTSTSTVGGGAAPCSGFCPQSGFELGSLGSINTDLVVIALIAITIGVIIIGISTGRFKVRS